MKKIAGWIIAATAAAWLALVVAFSVLNLVDALIMDTPSLGAAGFRAGSLLGIGFNLFLYGGLGVGALGFGLSLINPNRYSSGAIARSEFERIYRKERLAERQWDRLPDSVDYYLNLPEPALKDVYRNIDQELAAERFTAILWAIKKRVEEGNRRNKKSLADAAASRESETDDSPLIPSKRTEE